MQIVILIWVGLLMTDSPETQYDFWVGRWDAKWTAADGSTETGRNVISKTLDGNVIEERFEILSGKNAGFKGMSISVYQTRFKRWKQAWADNQGGYYDFTGRRDGDKRFFTTAAQTLPDGRNLIQRMVFYGITADSFTWDWELSADGGKTWKLNWRIFYTREQN